MKILIVTNELLNTCGVSKHLYELLSGFRTFKDLEILIVTGGGNAISKFETLGYEIIVNENFKHEKRSPIGFIKAIFWLIKLIAKRKIAVVHSHHHYAANIAQAAKLFTNTHTIITNHGILPEIGILSHFPSDHIIAVNQYVVDYISRKNPHKNKSVHLIHYGIRNRSTKNKRGNEILRFISASRIVKEKSIDTFIKAISLLPDSVRNKAEFLIAGEGNYLNDLIKLESEIQSGVKFIGVIEDLQLYLNQTDVFVMTSKSSSEGFPTALVEAGYAKNLIITSNFKGLDNIFKDNTDGIVFEVNNPTALSEKILFTINNFEKLKMFIENFYSKSICLFDPNTFSNKTFDLYQSVKK